MHTYHFCFSKLYNKSNRLDMIWCRVLDVQMLMIQSIFEMIFATIFQFEMVIVTNVEDVNLSLNKIQMKFLLKMEF